MTFDREHTAGHEVGSYEWWESLMGTKCAELDHPLTTYNPNADSTWCACGAVRVPGRAIPNGPHVNCCGGPLDRKTWPEYQVYLDAQAARNPRFRRFLEEQR